MQIIEKSKTNSDMDTINWKRIDENMVFIEFESCIIRHSQNYTELFIIWEPTGKHLTNYYLIPGESFPWSRSENVFHSAQVV